MYYLDRKKKKPRILSPWLKKLKIQTNRDHDECGKNDRYQKNDHLLDRLGV